MHHVSISNKPTRCSWAVTSITAIFDYSTCFGCFLPPGVQQLYMQPLAQVHCKVQQYKGKVRTRYKYISLLVKFQQHLEQIYLKQLLDASTITFYTRYVDILIVYNTKLISPVTICKQINKVHLIFSPTHEMNNTIRFLDLQITRLPTTIDIDIYRKPTKTDTTINFRSNHPIEHKMAAYRYLINRMLMLPLTPANREIEWHTILTITNNNNFPPTTHNESEKEAATKNQNK